MHENELYFSKKHQFYKLKVKMFVLQNVVAEYCTNHYPQSVFEITVTSKNIFTHKLLSEKAN